MTDLTTPRPELWSLDPAVLHLNHGSYGAVPVRTQQLLAALRAETDANPMAWFRSVGARVAAARLELATYLETDPAGFALVANASAGVTAALATLPIPAGSRIVLTDHTYGAVRFAAERFARLHGAEVVTVHVPLEADDDTVVATISAALEGPTAVLVVDQISSATAMTFPIGRLVEACHAVDVPIVVDGAHAPALIDAPAADGADFWTGNFHKWPCSPRGTAGLVVAEKWRDSTLPLVVSWSEYGELPERFDMQATQDYAAWIAAPESLRVLAGLEWPRRRQQLSHLLDEGALIVAKALGTGVAQVVRPAATLRLVELPGPVQATLEAGEALKIRASREIGAEITLTGFDGRRSSACRPTPTTARATTSCSPRGSRRCWTPSLFSRIWDIFSDVRTVEDSPVEARLAGRLAGLRVEHGWSLDELAQRTGVSRSTLSRLERAEISPTAALLGRLCAAYERTMSRLLAEVESEPPQLVRADQQVFWRDEASGFTRRSVSPPHPGLRGEVVEGVLQSGADISYDGPPVPGLEQHIWVLEGVLEVTAGGDVHEVGAGDCLRFRLWDRSRFRCPGPDPVRYAVMVVLP